MFIHPTTRAGRHFENFNTMAKRMSNENKTQPIGFVDPLGKSATQRLKTQLSGQPFSA
jgi:hypothetical protein